ncbi:MAG: hypothetical protein ACQEQU_08555 [Spirochaetota bacterium]
MSDGPSHYQVMVGPSHHRGCDKEVVGQEPIGFHPSVDVTTAGGARLTLLRVRNMNDSIKYRISKV